MPNAKPAFEPLLKEHNESAAALPPGAVGMSTPAPSAASSGLSGASVNLPNMGHVAAETWGRWQALSNRATGYKVGNDHEKNLARALEASKWSKLNAAAKHTWETVTLPAEHSKSMRYSNRFLGQLHRGALRSPEDFEAHKRDSFAFAFGNRSFKDYHKSVGHVVKQSIPNEKWADEGFPIEFLYCDFAKSPEIQEKYCQKARDLSYPSVYPALKDINLRQQFPAKFAAVAALTPSPSSSSSASQGGKRAPVKSRKRSNRRRNTTRRR